MTLDEAIQHCKEQVQEQAKKGCYSCAEEHQQLAEWLKELKAYREQSGDAISNLAMCHILNHEVKWINERMTREGVGRMNEAEKERLIKKDIESVENRVRHAFNQGFEMGLKESRSEIPNTCGDTISRQAVLDGLASIAKTKAKSDAQKSLMGRVMFFTEQLPPVTPQQRTGRWIETAEEYYKAVNEYGGGVNENTPYFVDDIACSECLAKYSVIDNETERFDHCPSCGAKMEV